MYKIKKEFHFSAAHQLHGLPEEHPCSRLHGHNYIIIIELSSPVLNNVGFVKDYRALDPIKRWIDDNLDHQNLNEVLGFNPTAEKIAEYLYYRVLNLCDLSSEVYTKLQSVTVKETEKTAATYEQ